MKIRLFITIPLLLISILVKGQEANKECFAEINSNDLKLMMETKDVLIIDVRLNKEYRKERIENAFLASSGEALRDLLATADKNQIIILYCKEGSRSRVAAEIACNDLKFKKVFNLEGGISDWKKKGYYVDKDHVKSSIN